MNRQRPSTAPPHSPVVPNAPVAERSAQRCGPGRRRGRARNHRKPIPHREAQRVPLTSLIVTVEQLALAACDKALQAALDTPGLVEGLMASAAAARPSVDREAMGAPQLNPSSASRQARVFSGRL